MPLVPKQESRKFIGKDHNEAVESNHTIKWTFHCLMKSDFED